VAKTLIIGVSTVTRNVEDFETFAKLASPLKKHGQVCIGVSSLAEKTQADVPEGGWGGGSAWHEYTSLLSSLQKFFPHKKMQPFLDMKHVKKNRELLRAKAKVVKKYGYQASFSTHIPFFLPEAFFAKYPHLRGARVDHPRRSKREAFAPCVDHPEMLEMIKEMMGELAREVPEIRSMRLATNDAGGGLCWADWLYAGPNGPACCRHISTAQRAKRLMEAIREGAGKERMLDLQMDGNFSEAEWREMNSLIDENFHFHIHWTKGVEHQVNATGVPSSGGIMDNPVRGIFDPVGIAKMLDGIKKPEVTRIGLNFGYNYNRGRELDDVVEKVVEIVDAFLKEPAHGSVERLLFVRKLCEKWVGTKRRDELLEALIAMNDAYRLKEQVAWRLTGNYYGVSMRIVNRPLVIMPDKLTAEEESYFLPYVFNTDVNEARMDYRDWHGAKLEGGPIEPMATNKDPRLKAMDAFSSRLKRVAGTLENMGDSPTGELLSRMGQSLWLYACVMRSANNFFATGVVRDRNAEKLMGPAHIPPKIGDWTGDPDLQLLNSYMRDELDNAAEMAAILENGGMRQMVIADNAKNEDTFLLGPDLIKQLKRKCEIMQRHWLDAEAYMTIPHK